MITIDGSYGEGGGQILRTSLALSLITREPFNITHIRAKRRKPGLMRQHLTAVQAASAIGKARVEGLELGSTNLTFVPEQLKGGKYRFSIGTAGSTTLILQTVLPALLLADQPSQLTLEGGTHNPLAPPYHFIEKAFLPLMRRMGAEITMELERPGFYPAGGGVFHVTIQPCKDLKGLELMERGEVKQRSVLGLLSQLPFHIIEREFQELKRRLNWEKDCFKPLMCESKGPGNVLIAELVCENVTEVFTTFGEKNKRAETVASSLVKMIRRYLSSEAALGEYLADQILLPMVLAGKGAFTTLKPSGHTLTNIHVIRKFLSVSIDLTEIDEDRTIIRIQD